MLDYNSLQVDLANSKNDCRTSKHAHSYYSPSVARPCATPRILYLETKEASEQACVACIGREFRGCILPVIVGVQSQTRKGRYEKA